MPDVVVPGPSHTLVTSASPRVEALARRALVSLHSDLPPGPLPDGSTAALAWWPLRLVPDGSAVRVLAPSGFGDDDLTTVLGLFALQLALARRVGVDAPGFDPDAVVHVAPGTLDAEAVMLARSPEPEDGSTGWHLRPDGPLQVYAEAYETLSVRDLLDRRNSLLVPLPLPAGLIVKVRGDLVVAVIDGKTGLDRLADP